MRLCLRGGRRAHHHAQSGHGGALALHAPDAADRLAPAGVHTLPMPWEGLLPRMWRSRRASIKSAALTYDA